MLRLARREPSAVLLIAQLAAVLLYPFMDSEGVGRALFSVFGIAILGLVVLAVRSTPGLTWIGVALGVPATVLLLIQAITGSSDPRSDSSIHAAACHACQFASETSCEQGNRFLDRATLAHPDLAYFAGQ